MSVSVKDPFEGSISGTDRRPGVLGRDVFPGGIVFDFVEVDVCAQTDAFAMKRNSRIDELCEPGKLLCGGKGKFRTAIVVPGEIRRLIPRLTADAAAHADVVFIEMTERCKFLLRDEDGAATGAGAACGMSWQCAGGGEFGRNRDLVAERGDGLGIAVSAGAGI